MDTDERNALKEQLRAMAAGRGDGIDLDSAERWVIEDLSDSLSFFRHLNQLIPAGSVLYFEGCGIRREVARFYEDHKAQNAVCVVQDTIFPIPETFHVQMTPEIVEGIIFLLKRHSLKACFSHVKAYRDGKLLFAFHDAFDGSDLLVSDVVPDDRVRTFCSSVGAEFRREPNLNKRDPAQLRRFLQALENPQGLRMSRPWWKKLLFFWKN